MQRLIGTVRGYWHTLLGMRPLRTELVLRDGATWVRAIPEPAGWFLFAGFAMSAIWLAIGWNFSIHWVLDLVIYALSAWPVTVVLAVILAVPGYEARIGDGRVQVAIHRPVPIGPRGWEEPLTAYRGLHARIERWEGPAPMIDLDRAEGRSLTIDSTTPRRVEVDRSLAPRHQDGVLMLEHATNPARSLPLARRQGRAIETAYAQDLARQIGLPLRWTH